MPSKEARLKLRELGKAGRLPLEQPTKDPEMYAEKLTNLGIETPASTIVNTVVSMTRWLSHNHPDATVFPIAEAAHTLARRGRHQDVRERRGDRLRHRQLRPHLRLPQAADAFDAIWYHKRARS